MTGPHYTDDAVTLYAGDCLDVLSTLPDASVDAVVTDPPYGLEFMGKEWDAFKPANAKVRTRVDARTNGAAKSVVSVPEAYIAGHPFQTWCQLWAAECLRVLKPGGHGVFFGGTRTFHRLACALEDAGFEIRDSLAWIHGQGFPKGRRVNTDERFCHCAEPADTSSRTSLGTLPADHTHTADAWDEAEHEGRSAHRATRTVSSSPGGYRPEHGSGGGLLHPVPAADPTSPPSPADALGRSRSDGPGDDLAAGPSRNPYPAPHSDRPSSQGSALLGQPPSDERPHTLANTSPVDTSESARRIPGMARDPSLSKYSNGFPRCSVCGKPNADGWNVALKPAFEPVVVARKPLASGTVAANVLRWGTGALNIDGCRLSPLTADEVARSGKSTNGAVYGDLQPVDWKSEGKPHPGRWPANVALDETAAAALDHMSGESSSPAPYVQQTSVRGEVYGLGSLNDKAGKVSTHHGDFGGASRFFYTAKAGSDERITHNGVAHPTVKPLALMRWLVRLVTPPGGLILEPFAGSGTTVEAAILEGFRCIAIEREADYLPLITQRINRRLDPVAYLAAAGEDLGIFDFEEPA